MPNFGPDYDLATRLKRVEDWIARQQANPLGQAFSASQSDGSVGWQVYQDPATGATAMVFYQGTTTSRDPNTDQHPALLFIGELYSNGALVDSGAIWSRPTGTQAMVIGNRGAQIFDTKGHRVFGTDEYGGAPSGEGLTEPWLTLSTPTATGVGDWPKTASTSMSVVAECQFVAQHPRVWWVGQAYADAGTDGQVQVEITNGSGTVVAGQTYSVTGGNFTSTNDVLTLPSGFWGQAYTFHVMSEVTSGAGNVYAQTFNLYGIGS